MPREQHTSRSQPHSSAPTSLLITRENTRMGSNDNDFATLANYYITAASNSEFIKSEHRG